MNASESILVCEGFQDRAFLTGWLKTRGMQPWMESERPKPYPPNDDKPLRGAGHYAFGPSPWVRVVPAKGDVTKVLAEADVFVKKAPTRGLDHLICVVDVDDVEKRNVRQTFATWAEARGAQLANGTWTLQSSLGSTRLSLMLWHCDDAGDDVPAQQTLERLVCCALREVYPDRVQSVVGWLAARPGPPGDEKPHKTHAAANMAGWYAERGSESFFEAVWEDKDVSAALLDRLERGGAKAVLDAVLAATA
jgi:hypothetical protein